MMGHMINVEKQYATPEKSTVSTGSMMDVILAMMGDILKREKPDATPEEKNERQLMRNLFGICKIMKDAFIKHDDEE